MDQHRESEIVSGLLGGDADAWRELYDTYAETIWVFIARRMTPHAPDVADVVQETFLAAAQGVRGFDPKQGTLLSWLTGIARRHVALYYRKKEREDRVRRETEKIQGHSRQVIRWLDSREPQPPDVLQSREMATEIHATLSRLSDEYEELLTWKYLQGDEVERIATRLGASSTAVRSKLARARKAFRKAFTLRIREHSLTGMGTDDPHDN